MTPTPTFDVLDVVQDLQRRVSAAPLPLEISGAAEARQVRDTLGQQLEDYLLPRLRSLDAPMLCVVGGSTGAGKSTIVNTLVGHVVSAAGALRPTTRSSVLVHHPDDQRWFMDDRVLPGLSRTTGSAGPADPRTVRLVASESLPRGLALLDAPDIDSVVAQNRELSRQLLAAADLWLFVTTAARYADAVPWSLLHEASERGTALAIVLDRVPQDVMEEVRSHFTTMLREQGLHRAPVFPVAETVLDEQGRLPGESLQRLASWMQAIATDSAARSRVVRQTLDGAMASLGRRAHEVADGVKAQSDAVTRLRDGAHDAYASAVDGVLEGMSDGVLLRGEVLARWQDLVGTGELFRQLESGVSRARDKVTAWVRGEPTKTEDVEEALQTGVAALVMAHGETAAADTARVWRASPGGMQLLAAHPDLHSHGPELQERVERLVRDWQGEVFAMVRDEAGARRSTARFLAFGVNGLGVLLMVVAFSATAGLTGAELVIAGSTGVLAQRILEAIFGDQAVRSLAKKARAQLLDRVQELYDAEQERYTAVLDATGVDEEARDSLVDAADAVDAMREGRR